MTTVWRIGLAVAVLAATAAYATLGPFDTPVVPLLVTHTVFSGTVLGWNLYRRRSLRRMVEVVRAVTPIVATGLIDAPEAKTGVLISEVRALGFTETHATDAAIGGRSIRTWILLEPTGETWVEIGMAGTSIAIFLSVVAGGRLIETAYPHGETIDHPRLLALVATSSAQDAFDAERAAVRAAGGSVRQVRTIDDYLAAERDERARTGGLRIQAHLDRIVGPTIRDYAISLALDGLAFGLLLASGTLA